MLWIPEIGWRPIKSTELNNLITMSMEFRTKSLLVVQTFDAESKGLIDPAIWLATSEPCVPIVEAMHERFREEHITS